MVYGFTLLVRLGRCVCTGMRVLLLTSPLPSDSTAAAPMVFPCVCFFARSSATVLRVFCLQPTLLSMRWNFQSPSPGMRLSWHKGQWLQFPSAIASGRGLHAVLWACSLSLVLMIASEQRGHWVNSALCSHFESRCSVKLAISTTCLHWRHLYSIGQCFQ